MDSAYANLYEETVRFLLKTYAALAPKVIERIKVEHPRKAGQSERAHDAACRDIQRHRMATQTHQDLSINYGYNTPHEIVAYGLRDTFDECMARAADAYAQIARDFPLDAQYVLPLAYRIRVLIIWNLRELCHFIQLRSAKQGHFAYREIAQRVYREIERVHPLLARSISELILQNTRWQGSDVMQGNGAMGQ